MKQDNNTLVILTPGFPGSEVDSTCLPMQQSFVRSLKEHHPLLNIIVLSFQYPYHKKTYQWNGITVIPFNGQNKGGFARLLLRRKINGALRTINSNNTITGILSFWYGECAVLGKRFADQNNIKHYCWLLGQDARKENKYPGRVPLGSGELIALSDFLQDEFEKNHGVRPDHVIPPGIEATAFSSSITEKDIDIIAAGSLIPLKQFEIFVEAVAAIKKEQPDIKAVLIGAGPEKEKLQALITTNGLGLNIILTGELPHIEVLQWMQRAKVFLHPSLYEGFGVVIIEALYAGCHAISFCKAMKQDIEHWHIVNNKEEMSRKTVELLQNPGTIYRSVTPFPMGLTVKKMTDLFGY